ncbi:nuclear transcription factor Y subunit B-3-like protein [Carex littledalei]|uniref:Nuclear transcription factor Y subunit B-3-like protein n=1 Tax=Carex littledalei TaxID=544730 RepID=A0A833QB71_9POAL|nr:nuclear transcription factor Y subunit B-3-like protein [Carex littledalei]
MADSDNESGGQRSTHDLSFLREQDHFLPIANVSRIMKRALPANAKISKDAKETMQECVSEFISFITGEASDKCQREKRKTVNGDDLIWAMTTLGFEDYVEPLKVYLQRFRELEGDKGIPQKEGGVVEGTNIHAGAMGMTGQSVSMVPGLVHEQEMYYQQMRANGLGFGTGGTGGSSSGPFGR